MRFAMKNGQFVLLIAEIPCNFQGQMFRAACLQNETSPEKLLYRYEKRFEKREKDPKNDPKRVWNIFGPSQAA